MNPADELPDDELVSAVLDDEADPAGRARVQADPHLSARLDEFRTVQAAVRAPRPDDAAADAARRAALDAFFAASAADHDHDHGHREAPAPVARLADRRARAAGRVPARWLGAAAAVVLVMAGAVAVLGRGGGGEASDSAAESSVSADAPTSKAASGAAAFTGASGAESARSAADTAGGASGSSPSAGPASVELGSFGDVDPLARAFRASSAGRSALQAAIPPSVGGPSPTATAPAAAGPACAAGPLAASATVAGRPVVLQVDGGTVRVLDRTTCTVVATFPVAGPTSG